jgi:hypothetical protein
MDGLAGVHARLPLAHVGRRARDVLARAPRKTREIVVEPV